MTDLIVALDEARFEDAVALVDKTRHTARWYKVGYQAFYAYGERIIAALRERDASLFLDLKLHDIPQTVGAAVRAVATRFAPALLTVHAAGGPIMLGAAAQARDEINASGGSLRILAVTVLTSLSNEDLRATGSDHVAHELVSIQAELALRARIDGVVCSVDEIALVRARTGEELTVVCPGIRPRGEAADDQRRVATPTEAALAGADFVVVGRPIARAADPAAAAAAIVAEMAAIKPLGAV